MSAEPILEVRDVSKRFGGTVAVDSVSLDLHEGEVLGLVGPNGSGKSTLINLISGVHSLSKGAITFRGKRISGLPPHRIAREGIARTFQIVRPLAGLDLQRNVLVGQLFGSAASGRGERRSMLEESDKALGAVGLYDKRHHDPEGLTSSELKRLEIARALAMKPRLLLLDEAMAGLNTAEVDEMTALIRRVNAEGVTVIFIEHMMRPVMAISDRVMVLHHGSLLALDIPEKVVRDEAVIAAYLGSGYGNDG